MFRVAAPAVPVACAPMPFRDPVWTVQKAIGFRHGATGRPAVYDRAMQPLASAGPDHRALLGSLSPGQRRELCAQAAGPAALRLSVHLGAAVAGGTYIALGLPLWWAAMLPHGIALVFLFTALHETIHRTAFRTGRANDAAAHLLGFLVLLGPRHFRCFHLAHHRFTHDPRHDPELAAPKPGSLSDYLVHLSGLPDWRWRVRTLLANAARPNADPFVPARSRAAVRREAVAFLAGYAGVAGVSIALGSSVLVWTWLLPLILGNPFLRGYLLAEHGRCPHVADMLRNSRTTATTRLMRWLAWNMPYHAEHHACPAVPFHRLPQLHAMLRREDRAERGYSRFNARYARAAASGALPANPGRG